MAVDVTGLTNEEYYSDSDNFGGYQYISLRDFVTDFMTGIDEDDYISTTTQHKVLLQSKRGIRELYNEVTSEVRAIEIDLSPTLQIALPQDFINLVRVSLIDESGYLRPIAVDKNSPISRSYLQDHEYNLLFDNTGEIISGTSTITQGESSLDSNRFEFCTSFREIGGGGSGLFGGNSFFGGSSTLGGFNPNTDLSEVYPNGSMTLDRSQGIMRFSSGIETESVVIEYISDGLFSDSDINIPKLAEEALNDYVYYHLIRRRRSVPANEIERARLDYNNSKRKSKLRLKPLRTEEIRQMFRGDSRWIKE